LESFGRLLKNNLKLFVYPSLHKDTGGLISVDNVQMPPHLHKLYEYLKERGSFIGLDDCDRSLLNIYPRDVLEALMKRDPKWKTLVPAEVIEAIETKGLFLPKQEAAKV
jgi:DNA-directed RNA polymerase delta subunit